MSSDCSAFLPLICSALLHFCYDHSLLYSLFWTKDFWPSLKLAPFSLSFLSFLLFFSFFLLLIYKIWDLSLVSAITEGKKWNEMTPLKHFLKADTWAFEHTCEITWSKMAACYLPCSQQAGKDCSSLNWSQHLLELSWQNLACYSVTSLATKFARNLEDSA